MKKLLFIFNFIFLFQPKLFGGDYSLYVCDHPDKKGEKQSYYITYATSDDVIQSIEVRFLNPKEKEKVPLWKPAITNGHISFCSKKEIEKIARFFVTVLMNPKTKEPYRVLDYIFVMKNYGKSKYYIKDESQKYKNVISEILRKRLKKLQDKLQ